MMATSSRVRAAFRADEGALKPVTTCHALQHQKQRPCAVISRFLSTATDIASLLRPGGDQAAMAAMLEGALLSGDPSALPATHVHVEWVEPGIAGGVQVGRARGGASPKKRANPCVVAPAPPVNQPLQTACKHHKKQTTGPMQPWP